MHYCPTFSTQKGSMLHKDSLFLQPGYFFWFCFHLMRDERILCSKTLLHIFLSINCSSFVQRIRLLSTLSTVSKLNDFFALIQWFLVVSLLCWVACSLLHDVRSWIGRGGSSLVMRPNHTHHLLILSGRLLTS